MDAEDAPGSRGTRRPPGGRSGWAGGGGLAEGRAPPGPQGRARREGAGVTRPGRSGRPKPPLRSASVRLKAGPGPPGGPQARSRDPWVNAPPTPREPGCWDLLGSPGAALGPERPGPRRAPGRRAPHSQPVSRRMLSTSGILAAWELREPMAELPPGRRSPRPPPRRGRLVAPGPKAAALAGSQAPEPRRSLPPTRDPGKCKAGPRAAGSAGRARTTGGFIPRLRGRAGRGCAGLGPPPPRARPLRRVRLSPRPRVCPQLPRLLLRL